MSKRIQVIVSDELYEKVLSKIAETKHTESKQCAIFIEQGVSDIYIPKYHGTLDKPFPKFEES